MEWQEKAGTKERDGVMLKRFTFRNCYSFKDETSLSMEAVYGMKDNVDFIVEVENKDCRDYILPVAAIYGANAGGKSNVIWALRDAARNICERQGIFNIPFLLTEEFNDKFEHCLNLLIGGYEYIYSYTANSFCVIKESLTKRSVGSANVKDFAIIFSREGETITDSILSGADLNLVETAAKNTGYLIVNSVATLGIVGCSAIYDWCASVLSVILIKSEEERRKHLDTYAGYLAENDNVRDRLNDFISKFSPAIVGVCPFVDGGMTSQNEEQFVMGIGHRYIKPDGSRGVKYLRTQRESNGTQKVLEMYPVLAKALDNGSPLVIDELDTMLHPLVFKKIVSLFNDKKTNPRHAQLIFAAHNTEVMNREDLRRDEIHIVEKDDDSGISSVVRLSDFVDEKGVKVRMDARYDRLYLEGLLGSIPSDFQDAEV